jgi:hypothetical protein
MTTPPSTSLGLVSSDDVTVELVGGEVTVVDGGATVLVVSGSLSPLARVSVSEAGFVDSASSPLVVLVGELDPSDVWSPGGSP